MTRTRFLGPVGTFTQVAAQHWAGIDGELEPMTELRQVYESVENESCDFGVVAIENSVEGYVVPSLDLLLNSNVVAVDEFQVPITFDAFVLPDCPDVPHVVVSHPHALAQCGRFIQEVGVPVRPATSTAAACRDLKPGEIGIGPNVCGDMYGLRTLRSAVEDYSGARTRFLLLTDRTTARERIRGMAAQPAAHMMIAATPQVTGPGVLARLATCFADRGINLTSLISRPLKGHESKYCFVLTLGGHPQNAMVRGALEELLAAGDVVKTLGVFESFPSLAASDLVPVAPKGSARIASSTKALDEALLWG